MKRGLFTICLLAIVAVSVFWLSAAKQTSTLPTIPQSSAEYFEQRETILADLRSNPNSWPGHLALTAEILTARAALLQRDKRWSFEGVRHQNDQIIFTFHAREPNRLRDMFATDPDTVAQLFTRLGFRWLCEFPHSAAIWDLHAMEYEAGDYIMILAVRDRGGTASLFDVPVAAQPCADRYAVSDG